MFQDRWYQQEAEQSLFNYFDSNKGNPLVALPTGTGKSVIIANFLYHVLCMFPNQRIIVATHMKELIQQNYDKLLAVWPQAPAGIYSVGLKRRELTAPLMFAGIKSIVGIADLLGHVDLLLIDEAHMLNEREDSEYMRLILILKSRNPFLKVIGFTATAFRAGMGLLTNGQIFTDICYDLCNIPGFKRLFDEGYIVPPRSVPTKTEYDWSNVKLNGSEYSNAGMNEVTKDAEISWKAIQESLARGHDRHCRLVFCTGVDHAIMAQDMLRALGLNAHAVHSRMSDGARDDILNAYKAGEFDTLTNNGIATTGLDCPRIDHIIGLRLTNRVGLMVQMLGRGMRPYEIAGWHKEDCLVTDHAGNARRLGTIDDPYIPKMKGKGTGDMPVRICPVCDTYNHAAARFCFHCGEPFERSVQYKPTSYDDALVRSDAPIIMDYDVSSVYYTQHLKRDASPSTKPVLRATYQCGMLRFTEVQAFESNVPFAVNNAKRWWKQRFPQEGFVPSTVAEAMQFVDKLIPPKTIKVWVNKKFPEILDYAY